MPVPRVPPPVVGLEPASAIADGEQPVWALSVAEVIGRSQVDPARGLDASEAAARLTRHGPNRLRDVRPPSAWEILVAQFASGIVLLLGAAGGIALALGDWMEGAAIFAVLVINAAIGFVTELRAVRSMEALRDLGTVRARVRRNGREVALPATALVPGDVAILEAGDVVTADARVLAASKLEVDESALTGESVPVEKGPDPADARAPLAERGSMLYKGTSLVRGSAEALVVATGMATELGRIARLVQEAEAETTPLEKRLTALGQRLLWVALVLAAITALLGILAGEGVYLMLETGIALAVAAVPEGLPIVATIALARGMRRMARRHALVNRLAAVETLGATTVICTDKTGTLTENRMAARRVALAEGVLDVGASGSTPAEQERGLRAAAELGVLCNNATLDESGAALGEPTEVALPELGARLGLHRPALLERYPEQREEAFDPRRRMMATVHGGDAGPFAAVKGAPEAVLDASTSVLTAQGTRSLGAADRQRWKQLDERLASEGLRVLGVARRDGEPPAGDPYRDLTLVALVGLADPPRPDVAPAIAACRTAGIRVVMVTGDHAATARSIAGAVGLVADGSATVVSGTEIEDLARLSEARRREIEDALVFARVSPEQKLDLIADYQRRGHVVAMTGDGVNDAPALRKADIGVAMGKRGTQVAREAADMVLTDDAFGSIVAAIEQGRVILDDIRKFVFYLLSCNVSEVLVVSLAVSIGEPLPLRPLQILFLNLVTDVFPALALAFGEGGPQVLRRPPRDPREPLVTRAGWIAIGAYGLVISASVLVAQHLAARWLGYDRAQVLTVAFLTLASAQLWHVFDTRSKDSSPWRNEVTRNPWIFGALLLCAALLLAAIHVPGLARVLGTAPLGAEGWILVAVAGLAPLAGGELWRALARRRVDAARSPT